MVAEENVSAPAQSSTCLLDI